MTERLAWHYVSEGAESQTEIVAEGTGGLSKGINSVKEKRAKLQDSLNQTDSSTTSK